MRLTEWFDKWQMITVFAHTSEAHTGCNIKDKFVVKLLVSMYVCSVWGMTAWVENNFSNLNSTFLAMMFDNGVYCTDVNVWIVHYAVPWTINRTSMFRPTSDGRKIIKTGLDVRDIALAGACTIEHSSLRVHSFIHSSTFDDATTRKRLVVNISLKRNRIFSARHEIRFANIKHNNRMGADAWTRAKDVTMFIVYIRIRMSTGYFWCV